MLPFYIPFLSGYKTGALTRCGLHSQKINFSIKDFFIFCDVLMVIFSQVEQKSSVTFQLFPKTNSSELHKNHYITAIKKTIKCFIAFGCTAYTSPTIHTSVPFFPWPTMTRDSISGILKIRKGNHRLHFLADLKVLKYPVTLWPTSFGVIRNELNQY